MNTFTSNFAPHIEAMLEWRTSLGHSLRDMRNAMTGFDRFCSSHHPGETVLTRELATAWCRDTATGTWGAYRSRAVREFGKYLQLAGVDGFIVPSAWITRPVRGLPHMFTDEELAAFFRAADSIDAAQRHALVEQALRELPQHQRVPLVLYHFEELSYDEIAEQLRVSLPKVKTDIQRGRAALAKILARRGVLR